MLRRPGGTISTPGPSAGTSSLRPVPAEVDRVCQQLPDLHRVVLLAMCELVLAVADELGCGPVEQYLAWGQLSNRVAGGTPVRLAPHAGDRVALLVSCQTRLVGVRRGQLGHLEYDGNRAVVLDPARPLSEAEPREMVAMAVTYRCGARTT